MASVEVVVVRRRWQSAVPYRQMSVFTVSQKALSF